MKICILSKHNAIAIKTHYLFDPTDVLIFVEPAELQQYKLLHPEYMIISIKKNNQNLAEFKNFILNYIADDYFIIASDNINGFYMRNEKTYKYDNLYKLDNLLKSLQHQLQKQCVYTIIPLELHTSVYTTNKQLQTKRGVLNVQEPTIFYGINKKKLLEKNIIFDISLNADEIDFAIQLILNDENICFDYKYACSIDIQTKSIKDKQQRLQKEYINTKQLRQKYGISFIKLNYDDDDNFISTKIIYSKILSHQQIINKTITQHDITQYAVSQEINTTLLKKVLIALWLLDSTLTKPSLDDILDFSQKQSFQEAKEYIKQEIKIKKLSFVLNKIEIPLISILAKMKIRGIQLNTVYLHSLVEKYRLMLTEISNNIWQHAGKKFNISSSQQLSNILFNVLNLSPEKCKKTSTGVISTKESELKKLLKQHPIIKEILAYRELTKLLTTYIEPLPKLIDKEGCLHTTFLQTGTATGRMSSNKPNLQNIPVKSEYGKQIRKAFVAKEGFIFVAFDYSQIELRVAAILSNDEKMIKIFKNKEDIHTAVASEIFNVPHDKVNSSMRRKAKIVNFGILYGMGVNALRQNMTDAANDSEEITQADAQRFHDEYFKKFDTLAKYITTAKQEVNKLGYTKTLFGRLRYFKNITHANTSIKAMLERMAVNTPIQGTSADIIKLAMIKVDEYLTNNKLENDIKMLLQIHDELIFEMKTNINKKHIKKIKKLMETILPIEKTKGIILEINVKQGQTWDTLQDVLI